MQEKLKILEAMDVYLPDVDGVINCMHNYCLNLNDRTELTIAVPKNKRGYVDNQPYQIVRCKSMFIPILNNYYGFPNSDRKFKKAINEKQFDIIHCHSPFNMAKFVLKQAKKRGIPAVATFHSNMRPIFKSVVKSKFIAERMVKHLGKRYNKFDECFVCSPLVEEQLRSFGYTGKITYLPFGTDFKKCECVEENRVKANQVFNLDENELIFIYVGRVVPLKRIDFVLQSLKLVKDKGVNFKFYIVGKGTEKANLEKLAKKLGLTENVIFTGFLPREQFPLIFSRADLLLFPSLYDNFGLVKVEGASYKTPGLFIENSCAGYGIIDGEDGYLSKDTTTDFAEKILFAASDREKLKQVGEKAMESVYISWQECSNVLLERLNQIVLEHKKGK